MGDRLSRRDLCAALDFITGAYQAGDLDRFAAFVTRELLTLVPSECTSYNEVNVPRRRVEWITDGLDPIPDGKPIFERHITEHPFFDYFARPDANAAVTVADFISDREWRSRGIYTEFYRFLRAERVLGIKIPSPPELTVVFVNLRSGKNYTARDRGMFDLLAPHLLRAYEIAAARVDHRRDIALLDRGIDALRGGAIVLAPDGRIVTATAHARQWLADYFDVRDERLPDALARWAALGDLPAAAADTPPTPRRPFVVERDGRRLVAQLLPHGSRRLIIMEERRTMLRAEDLAVLGLARREAEILAWLALGKTDGEIAAILAISPRTVSHTLVRVYRKLGVETRVAAAAHALRAAATRVR